MKLQPVDWNQPQICMDCHKPAASGWQELIRTPGGPGLDKRCHSCAEAHYGKAVLESFAKEKPQTNTKKSPAPLLDQAG